MINFIGKNLKKIIMSLIIALVIFLTIGIFDHFRKKS